MTFFRIFSFFTLRVAGGSHGPKTRGLGAPSQDRHRSVAPAAGTRVVTCGALGRIQAPELRRPWPPSHTSNRSAFAALPPRGLSQSRGGVGTPAMSTLQRGALAAQARPSSAHIVACALTVDRALVRVVRHHEAAVCSRGHRAAQRVASVSTAQLIRQLWAAVGSPRPAPAEFEDRGVRGSLRAAGAAPPPSGSPFCLKPFLA